MVLAAVEAHATACCGAVTSAVPSPSWLSWFWSGDLSIRLSDIATGPIQHRHSLRDGPDHVGFLEMEVRMEQVTTVKLRISDITVQFPGPPPPVDKHVCVRLSLVGQQGPPEHTTLAENAFNIGFVDLSIRCSFEALFHSAIHIGLFADRGARRLSSSSFYLRDVYSFDPSTKRPVTLRLAGEDGDAGIVTANVTCGNMHRYLQMVAGVHSDNAITGGAWYIPDVPTQPGVQCRDPVVAPPPPVEPGPDPYSAAALRAADTVVTMSNDPYAIVAPLVPEADLNLDRHTHVAAHDPYAEVVDEDMRSQVGNADVRLGHHWRRAMDSQRKRALRLFRCCLIAIVRV